MGYHDIYKSCQDNPEAYWLEQSKAIDWEEAPRQALFDKGNDLYEWFADAKVNACYNAVDRPCRSGGDHS